MDSTFAKSESRISNIETNPNFKCLKCLKCLKSSNGSFLKFDIGPFEIISKLDIHISILLVFLLTPSAFAAKAPQDYTYDIVIRDAVVFDGKSLTGVREDVAINKDRIVFIGQLPKSKAFKIIRGKGLTLAPGFIDAHTHSDFNPLVYPKLANKIAQGVTTEIIGNCGMSAAPVIGTHRDKIRSVWAREGVQIPATLPWTTFREYRETLQDKGLSTNLAGLVGHGNLRSAVMGYDPRPASPSELEAMKKLLAQAMEDGAYGISFGLVYLPGVYADHEEVIELCHEAARHLGVCSFHMRSEGAKLLESIQEVIDVGAKAKARIQISHLKAGGKGNWGKIDEAFKLIEDARERGVRVEADVYPYSSGYAELGKILPDELYLRSDRNDYFHSLIRRAELVETMRVYDEKKQFNWDSTMIAATASPHYQRYEGMTLKMAAKKSNLEPVKFLIDILADTQFEVSAFYFSQTDEVVEKVVGKPYVSAGSDSIADGTRRPHPRAFGTFPKIIREYVREKKVITLGEAIRKMTSLPAEHFGLKDRGRIEVGAYADLVLFDAGNLKDESTYEDPTKRCKGIQCVLVNGHPVFENGKLPSKKHGRFLTNS
ncbi:MAG: D-aminoacylase [Candidatus Omnitrophica bacterium]|nr:D-aminoacylase [Candidatus Omnitrophota bacterium]